MKLKSGFSLDATNPPSYKNRCLPIPFLLEDIELAWRAYSGCHNLIIYMVKSKLFISRNFSSSKKLIST